MLLIVNVVVRVVLVVLVVVVILVGFLILILVLRVLGPGGGDLFGGVRGSGLEIVDDACDHASDKASRDGDGGVEDEGHKGFCPRDGEGWCGERHDDVEECSDGHEERQCAQGKPRERHHFLGLAREKRVCRHTSDPGQEEERREDEDERGTQNNSHALDDVGMGKRVRHRELGFVGRRSGCCVCQEKQSRPRNRVDDRVVSQALVCPVLHIIVVVVVVGGSNPFLQSVSS